MSEESFPVGTDVMVAPSFHVRRDHGLPDGDLTGRIVRRTRKAVLFVSDDLVQWLPQKGVTVWQAGLPRPAVDEGLATVTIKVLDREVLVSHQPYDVDLYEALCDIKPTHRRESANAWIYDATPVLARHICAAIEGLPLVADEEWGRLCDQAHAIERAQPFKTATDLPQPEVSRHDKPMWGHQLRAYHFARHLRNYGLWIAPGLGKSRTLIDLIQNDQDIRKVLILCPSKVVDVWPNQIREWGVRGDMVPIPLSAKRLKSVEKRRDVAQEKMSQVDAQGMRAVVIINVEAFWREPFFSWALEQDWDLMSMDESQRFAKANTRSGRAADRLAKRIDRRAGLSGTMFADKPTDAFGQYKILDRGIFAENYKDFASWIELKGQLKHNSEYVVGFTVAPTLLDGSPNERFDPVAAHKFWSMVDQISYFAGEEELDLPPLVPIEVEFDMSAKAKKLYKEVVKEGYADLDEHGLLDEIRAVFRRVDEGEATEEDMLIAEQYMELGEESEVDASNKFTELLRLQQITGGFVRDANGVDIEVDTAKRDALYNLLYDIHEPTVVFVRFHKDLDNVKWVADKLKRRFGELSGRRDTVLNDNAQMREGIDIAAVQIQAGGVGIDLTRSRIGVWYSLMFNHEPFTQAVRRQVRPGMSKRGAVHHYLLARGSIDGKILNTIRNKGNIIDYISRGKVRIEFKEPVDID